MNRRHSWKEDAMAIFGILAFIGAFALFVWFSKYYQAEYDKDAAAWHEQNRLDACDPYVYEEYK